MPTPSRPRPAKVIALRAPHGGEWVEADFADGFTGRVPNRILRGYCPCAACQGHGGEIGFRAGRDTNLRDIAPVGRYGLRLAWGDQHGEGIYTFEFLHALCELYREHGDALPDVHPTLPRTR